MTPKVTLFGVILGATVATMLLFGGPGVQIGRKKGESKTDRKKVTSQASKNQKKEPKWLRLFEGLPLSW